MNGESLNIQQDNLEKLKHFFPELFSEDQIDMEKFNAAFTGNINFANERYVLNWAGKADAFKTLQIPTTATLKPCPGEGINDGFSSLSSGEGRGEASQNVFIEGENLEVLKVLQKSYYNKVKCIIIDPPYNTGNDSFIYPDSFKENKTDYEKRVGDKDEEGFLMKEGFFKKNSKDSGHFHSNWLSMMYPRLFLAKNLLKDDGVIFIHIDDNEVHNLRLLMNEIFGEENFVATFPRITKKAGKTTDKIAKNNDYVLCFLKKETGKFNSSAIDDEGYKNVDIHFEERGYYKLSQTLDYGSIQYSPSLDYEIAINNKIFRPGGVSIDEMQDRKKQNPSSDFCWRWSRDLFDFGYKNDFVVVKESKYGSRIYTKTYQRATILKNNSGYFVDLKERTKSATSIDFIQNKFSNDNSRKDFKQIFDTNIFEYSKPVELIKELIKLSTNSDDIILDFFAGSGTTAQAVLELNQEDNGNRKFILVQLPEVTDENTEAYKAGYKTIAAISKERIRRVIKKIQAEITEEEKKKAGQLNLGDKNSIAQNIDLGFKAFKLSPSNFKIWRGNEITEENLTQQLDAFTNPVNENSQEQNMLYELMVKAGYELTDLVEANSFPVGEGRDGAFYSVNNGELVIALTEMSQTVIDKIIAAKPKKVITLDHLFAGDDQLKTNTVLQMKDAGVEFKTI